MLEVNENILEGDNKNVCPVCTSDNVTNHFCHVCNFDFTDVFSCPLLDDEKFSENRSNKICNVDRLPCKLKNLDYETCDKYHKYGQ